MEHTEKMLLSICIPNFNYGDYLKETFDSLHKQTNANFEICIADNASTDNSLEVINRWETAFSDFTYKVNSANLGFAGNLDNVAQMAQGEYMLMLSSDDIVLPDMIEVYERFIQCIQMQNQQQHFIFGSIPIMINSIGKTIHDILPDKKLWYPTDLDTHLSDQMGFEIYKVSSSEMLKRCLRHFRTPLHFITTCYQRSDFLKVGGYGGGRLYNPDKWFNWKLLATTDYIFYLNKPLFKYRWHENNQVGLQNQTGVLKYWLDEYRNCFELSESMLAKARLTSEDVKRMFIEHASKYILQSVMDKEYLSAKRLYNFVRACYPKEFGESKYATVIRLSMIHQRVAGIFLKLMKKIIKT